MTAAVAASKQRHQQCDICFVVVKKNVNKGFMAVNHDEASIGKDAGGVNV